MRNAPDPCKPLAISPEMCRFSCNSNRPLKGIKQQINSFFVMHPFQSFQKVLYSIKMKRICTCIKRTVQLLEQWKIGDFRCFYKEKRSAPGIRKWSLTLLLAWPDAPYLWSSGWDPEYVSVVWPNVPTLPALYYLYYASTNHHPAFPNAFSPVIIIYYFQWWFSIPWRKYWTYKCSPSFSPSFPASVTYFRRKTTNMLNFWTHYFFIYNHALYLIL